MCSVRMPSSASVLRVWLLGAACRPPRGVFICISGQPPGERVVCALCAYHTSRHHRRTGAGAPTERRDGSPSPGASPARRRVRLHVRRSTGAAAMEKRGEGALSPRMMNDGPRAVCRCARTLMPRLRRPRPSNCVSSLQGSTSHLSQEDQGCAFPSRQLLLLGSGTTSSAVAGAPKAH